MGTVGYLLDTHTFLWAAQKDISLSDMAKEAINDVNIPKYISAVSAYEIMNKYRLGKLPEYSYLAENYFEILDIFGAIELPINTRHMHFAGKFEWSHRDPFDRLLASQSFINKLTLLTNDSVFQEIPWIEVLW